MFDLILHQNFSSSRLERNLGIKDIVVMVDITTIKPTELFNFGIFPMERKK